MPDREKVIEDLQDLIEHLFHEYKVCAHGDEDECYGRFLKANNALNMLREQERKIEELEYNLAITEHNSNYYINGNE